MKRAGAGREQDGAEKEQELQALGNENAALVSERAEIAARLETAQEQAAATSRELDASASENARLVVEQEGMAAELARLQGSWQARLSVCSFLGTAASDTGQSVVPTLSKVWPSVPSRLSPDPVRWG